MSGAWLSRTLLHGPFLQLVTSQEEYKRALRAVIAEVTRLHKAGVAVEEAVKQANWGPYAEWYIAAQQGPIAVRRIYDELNGKLK